jgi:hypothetical protein
VGLIAGLLAGLFGVGGGLLVVPGLVFFLRMEQRLAHGTSLASIVVVSAAAAAGYLLDDAVDWTVAGLLLAGSAGGAVVGTHALQRLPRRVLRVGFSLLLLAAAARLFLFLTVPPPTGRGDVDVWLALALVGIGIGSGIVAGLLGVGGGIITVPALVILLSMPDVVAKGTSLLVILPTAAVGTAANVLRGNANLVVGGVVGLAGAGSAFGGALLALRLDPEISAVLFAVLLLAVAAQMLAGRGRDEPAG